MDHPLLLTPSSRRMVVTWAIDEKGYSQRHACALVGIAPKTYHYISSLGEDVALGDRLCTLAGQRRWCGYRKAPLRGGTTLTGPP
jgi:hypothetical protein